MQFRPKLLQRRAAASGVTPEKVYDVYMTLDGHFAVGEQDDTVEAVKRRRAVDRKNEGE